MVKAVAIEPHRHCLRLELLAGSSIVLSLRSCSLANTLSNGSLLIYHVLLLPAAAALLSCRIGNKWLLPYQPSPAYTTQQ